MSYNPWDDIEDYKFEYYEIEDILRWEDVDSLNQIDDMTLINGYNMCPECHSKLGKKKEYMGEFWGQPCYEEIIFCPTCGGV